MKYLVTGAAGFVGFHVSKALLERGDEVVGLDNFNSFYPVSLKEARANILRSFPLFTLLRGDVCDQNAVHGLFAEHAIERVVHLAAQAGVRHSVQYPFEHERVNVLGTLTLLEEATKASVRQFVFISSGSVYGQDAKTPLVEDDFTSHPISPYGASKRSAEIFCHAYHAVHGLPVVILRYFNVYGPWGRPDAAYWKFTERILERTPIDVYNFGKMTRTFTYIDDIVRGTLLALSKDFPFEIFNLGNERSCALEEFISEIEKSSGAKAEKNYMPLQQGDRPDVAITIAKARRLLGFEPSVQVPEGISLFVSWFKEYREKR